MKEMAIVIIYLVIFMILFSGICASIKSADFED